MSEKSTSSSCCCSAPAPDNRTDLLAPADSATSTNLLAPPVAAVDADLPRVLS